jgi:hypothetical protein
MRTGHAARANTILSRISFAHAVSARRLLLFGLTNLPLLIIIGSFLDGTWRMAAPARGLAQHYGYWTIFATSPIIILLVCFALQKFITAVQKTDQYCIGLDDETRRRLDKLIQRHVASLQMRSESVWVFIFIVVILLCWWIVNIVKTIHPVDTYGHDVFDSYAHPFGFYSAKAYIFIVFTCVYSVALFLSLHITVSLISILKFLRRNEILLINFFHADNCGGTAQFGNINLLILAVYANFFAIIYAMYETHHQTYFVMITSLASCSAVAALQSVAAVFHIHKAVAQKKQECIEEVAAKLNQQMGQALRGDRFRNDLLAFRNHLIGIHTFPYAPKALMAVNVIRFAPAVLGILSFFKGH